MPTCLPPAAYYHINRNTQPVKPRFKEPVDPEIQKTLDDLSVLVGTSREWEAAFRLTFGERSFEEDYPCIEWSDPYSWGSDAAKFTEAFVLADKFVWSVMHRLYPHQQYEMIPALTHALMSWSQRRHVPISPLDEQEAINLLNWSMYGDIADWLKQQQ